jgi:hypothetical protein
METQMDDSRDSDRDRLLAKLRPAWDTARGERILAAVMERLHGRRPPRRRLPALFTRLRFAKGRP